MPAVIPDNVDPASTCILSGKFINQILDWMRENTISIDDDSSPLQIREVGPQGKVLGLDTTTCS